MRDRMLACALGAAMLAIVASPVLQHRRPTPIDGFPLSCYPMFSARRGSTVTVVHVEASDDEGSWPVSYRRLGTGGFNQVRRQVARRARTADGASALARVVLQALADDDRPPTRVRVVRSRFVSATYLAGDRTPQRVRTLGTAARGGAA